MEKEFGDPWEGREYFKTKPTVSSTPEKSEAVVRQVPRRCAQVTMWRELRDRAEVALSLMTKPGAFTILPA